MSEGERRRSTAGGGVEMSSRLEVVYGGGVVDVVFEGAKGVGAGAPRREQREDDDPHRVLWGVGRGVGVWKGVEGERRVWKAG